MRDLTDLEKTLASIIILMAIASSVIMYNVYNPPRTFNSEIAELKNYTIELSDGTTLSYFENRRELIDFLSSDDTSEITYSPHFDCDDFARRMQKNAFLEGKIMNMVLVSPDEYLRYFGWDINGPYHAILSTVVGNELIYIEPQKDMFVRVAVLDSFKW